MKVCFLALVLAFLLIACADSNSPQNTNNLEILQKEAQNLEPMLEIRVGIAGRNPAGENLFFRLYENRLAEFDYTNDTDNTNETPKVVLKHTKISEEDFRKFQSLFDSQDYRKDFEIVKESYKGKYCTEESSIYRIKISSGTQRKNIVISPVCQLNELTNRDTMNSADIPVTLSELIRLAYVTSLKHIYKK